MVNDYEGNHGILAQTGFLNSLIDTVSLYWITPLPLEKSPAF